MSDTEELVLLLERCSGLDKIHTTLFTNIIKNTAHLYLSRESYDFVRDSVNTLMNPRLPPVLPFYGRASDEMLS